MEEVEGVVGSHIFRKLALKWGLKLVWDKNLVKQVVIYGLMRIEPLIRVKLQEMIDQIFGFRYLIPLPTCKYEFSSAYLLIELFISLAIKWRDPSDQYVEENTDTPHVSFLELFDLVVKLTLNTLRRHIVNLNCKYRDLLTDEIV